MAIVGLSVSVAVHDVFAVSRNAMMLFTITSSRNPGIGVIQSSVFGVKMEEMMCKPDISRSR